MKLLDKVVQKSFEKSVEFISALEDIAQMSKNMIQMSKDIVDLANAVITLSRNVEHHQLLLNQLCKVVVDQVKLQSTEPRSSLDISLPNPKPGDSKPN